MKRTGCLLEFKRAQVQEWVYFFLMTRQGRLWLVVRRSGCSGDNDDERKIGVAGEEGKDD